MKWMQSLFGAADTQINTETGKIGSDATNLSPK
ncbi:hypothetical protein B2K_39380 [Paenibacillus mucilaginosus K02]|uniref:Uncharacterized protein n=3 Tax=Paenibacillus mucilaginosus TaxID=61624 RepID=R9UN52_9BACL|nr:hypothetical protein B2K_39380 [Paenibacillus mucilaginosus K02]